MPSGCIHGPTACDFCRWDWEVVDKVQMNNWEEGAWRITHFRHDIRYFAMTLWLLASDTGIVDTKVSRMAFNAWWPESKVREALEVLERYKLVERIDGGEPASWELSPSGEPYPHVKALQQPGVDRWILAPGLEDWPAGRARERLVK